MIRTVSIALGRWVVCGIIGLALCACGSKTTSEQHYGKLRIASFDIPADRLREFAGIVPKPHAGKQTLLDKLTPDGPEWTSPDLSLLATANPYTVVVRMSATAPVAGPAASLWTATLGVTQDDGVERSTILPIAGLSDADEAAGKLLAQRNFERVAVARPASVKADQHVKLHLRPSRLENLIPTAMRVELWAGMAEPGWREILFGIPALLTGLVLVILWFFWLRRPRNAHV